MITFLMPRSRITNIVAVILDYLLFLKVLLHPDCPICHNKITYCYDLNRRAIVNLRDCLECCRIHRDGNVLGLPPKNLRYKSGEPETEQEIFHDLAGGVVSAWGESRGQ
jgi:hypothetical protein